MKYWLFSTLLFSQICPNCFQTRWETTTFAVPCQSAPAVVAELKSRGYRVFSKSWKNEDDPQVICDILGIK